MRMRCLWRTSAASVSAFLLALASCQATGIDTTTPPTVDERSPASPAVEATAVEASSQEMHMNDSGWLFVHGTGFNTRTKLIFDPPLPEGRFWQQMRSPTDMAIVKIRGAADPVSWRPEPGPLKVVAIQIGGGPAKALNPEGGGVVIAEVLANDHRPIVQRGITLRGEGYSFVEPEDSEVSVLSTDTIDDFIRADFAVVQFYAPWSRWSQKLFPEYTKASIELKRLDPDIKMGKVDMSDETNKRDLLRRFDVRAFPTIKIFRNGVEISIPPSNRRDAAGIVDYLIAEKAKEVMTIPKDPDILSIDASDTEIFPGRTQELLITGNAFSEADPPELRFEHALDRGVKTEVVNRTTIRMEIHADSSGSTILDGHMGPLTIRAIVTGPGNVMEVFTPGVVVATVMPNFTVSKSDEQVY